MEAQSDSTDHCCLQIWKKSKRYQCCLVYRDRENRIPLSIVQLRSLEEEKLLHEQKQCRMAAYRIQLWIGNMSNASEQFILEELRMSSFRREQDMQSSSQGEFIRIKPKYQRNRLISRDNYHKPKINELCKRNQELVK